MMDLNSLFDRIKRLIRNQNAYNPFHENFDKQIIEKFVNNELKTKGFNPNINEWDFKKITHLNDATLTFNIIHNSYSTYLENTIKNSNLSYSELINFSFALINREYLLVRDQLDNDIRAQNKSVFIPGLPEPKIESADETIGLINAIGAIENSIDVINYIVDFLIKFKELETTKVSFDNEIDCVNSIVNIFQCANIYTVVKNEYERAIWNNGFFEIIGKDLIIDFFSHKDLKLVCVGHRIMQQRTLNVFLNNDENKLNQKGRYKLKNRIKTCSVENGYLKYKLSSGLDKAENAYNLQRQAALDSYYEFVSNKVLPLYPNIDIEMALIMFNTISYLFFKVPKLNQDETGGDKKDVFGNYAYRMKKNDLKNYIQQRTFFSLAEINSFLSLIENDEKKLNLWKNQLFEQGSDYLFSLLSITHPVPYYIVDCWLEKGGISLKGRGKIFENYVREQLSKSSSIFEYKVIQQKNFKGVNNKKEEIDLIIKMKNTLIVAESKCLKYPIGIRDYHNYLKKLKEGCEQVNRKIEFLKINHDEFSEIIGDYNNVYIQGVVITNYSLYLGFNYNDIPIIDNHSFESYFKSGYLSKIEFSKKGRLLEKDFIETESFYKTEKEFNENIKSFLFNPPIV